MKFKKRRKDVLVTIDPQDLKEFKKRLDQAIRLGILSDGPSSVGPQEWAKQEDAYKGRNQDPKRTTVRVRRSHS